MASLVEAAVYPSAFPQAGDRAQCCSAEAVGGGMDCPPDNAQHLDRVPQEASMPSPQEHIEAARSPPQANDVDVPDRPCEPTLDDGTAASPVCNGSAPEECDSTTPPCNGVTGDTVNESDLTLRDEYVDRVWEEFVTHFLMGSCHIQKAAIFDLESQHPLAVSGNLAISKPEVEQLASSLHNLQLAYRSGVTVEGRTYKVQLADGRNGILAFTGPKGCTVCKTRSLIIIGLHDSSGSSRKCKEDVMRLGDFFRNKAL